MLLVSFVTSIVTAIVVVSLMSKAPTSVTRTINQIVERTVQTVAPSQNQGATVVTTEKTVVVNSDDLAAKSIAQVQKSIIRVVVRGGKTLITRGVLVDGKGTGITDAGVLDVSGADMFDAILPDGTRVPLTVRTAVGTSTPLAVVDVAVGTSTGWAPAKLADASKLQLGQSVIRIDGVGGDSVAEGVVSTLPTRDTQSEIESTVLSMTPGAVLFTLFGEVIGIATDTLAASPNQYTVITLPTTSTATSSISKPSN